MQRLTIFSIYDSKAQAYLQPFFSNNVETATREFATAVNGEGQFNRYAGDYSMFLLGTFDQDEGSFVLESAPIHCCNAITLLVTDNLAPRDPSKDMDFKRWQSSEEGIATIARHNKEKQAS